MLVHPTYYSHADGTLRLLRPETYHRSTPIAGPLAQPTRAQGDQAPSEILGIFCHKSFEFQVSSIGPVQEDGFSWYRVVIGSPITQRQR